VEEIASKFASADFQNVCRLASKQSVENAVFFRLRGNTERFQQLMQRVSRDDVKWKQANIAWTWLVEMTSRSENANEHK